MPELCRFQGIVIRMFWEPGAPHHRPHFHVNYQEHYAVYAVDRIELLTGQLPLRQQRLVEGWAELHQGELLDNWQRMLAGRTRYRIAPLK